MFGIGHNDWLIAIVVSSAIALTGCAGVQMEVDESPGPQEIASNLTIGEPTTNEVFDDIYCIGSVSELGGEAGFKIANQTGEFTSLRVIRTQTNKTQVHDLVIRGEFGPDDTFGLETPILPSVDRYRYRVKALNESGGVIDAVNITIADT